MPILLNSIMAMAANDVSCASTVLKPWVGNNLVCECVNTLWTRALRRMEMTFIISDVGLKNNRRKKKKKKHLEGFYCFQMRPISLQSQTLAIVLIWRSVQGVPLAFDESPCLQVLFWDRKLPAVAGVQAVGCEPVQTERTTVSGGYMLL